MKKFLVLLAIALVTGCGGGSSSSLTETPAPQPEGPASPPPPPPLVGLFTGTTESDTTQRRSADILVLADGTFAYIRTGHDGVIGKITSDGKTYSSTSATSFSQGGCTVSPASVSGTYVPGTSITGSVTPSTLQIEERFSGTAVTGPAPPIADIAGPYTGVQTSVSSSGKCSNPEFPFAALTINADGTLLLNFCKPGTISPRSDMPVYDVTFPGVPNCPGASPNTTSGFAAFVDDGFGGRRLQIFGTNTSGADQTLFVLVQRPGSSI